MPSDPSRPGSASLSAREMYSSMNGYMPNGYHGYDNMYSQSPYASSHMSSSPSSLYSRYEMGGMYSPSSTTTASAMSSYMNSSYMSMYGTSGSPYSSMSAEEGGVGGEGVAHPSHSPGSVKSEAGASGPPTGSSGTVSMSSGSPGSVPLGVPPPAGSGGAPPTVKREPLSGPLHPPGPPGPQSAGRPGQPDLNSMISMYLPPGDAAAAAAGDPVAQSRINNLTNQIYAGHYGLAPGPPHGSHSPEGHMGGVLPPPSAYTVGGAI